MSANRRTDTQLVLLSAAAQHPEGAIALAPELKGGAAKKAVGKLLRGGFIEEIPARGRCRSGGVTMTQDRWRSASRRTASPRSALRRASPSGRPISRARPAMGATSHPNGIRGGSKLPAARREKTRPRSRPRGIRSRPA
jgi:hypothetical protein